MPRPRRSKGRDKKKKEQENVVDGGQPAGVDPSQSTYQAPQSYDQSIDQSGLDAKMEDWKQQVRPEIDQGFGTVNEELQSYFKSVESTLDDPPFESAEDQRTFVDNVYAEVRGNELRLVVNTTCSFILEKLIRISDDFQLRVLADSLSGHTVRLFSDRCASHVLQTILSLSQNVIEREVEEAGADKVKQAEAGEDGELLSMEQLVLNMCEDIKPHFVMLLHHQFASHVIRSLLYVLAGKRINDMGDIKGRFRSKKSKQFKVSHDPYAGKISSKVSPVCKVPKTFKAMLQSLTNQVSSIDNASEMRTLAAHPIANPALQLLLELLEDDREGQKTKTVVLDRIMWGFASEENAEENTKNRRQTWFDEMMQDKAGTHLLEVILKIAPDAVYQKFYDTFFKTKLVKYSNHALSNFVIQALISNARTAAQLKSIIEEFDGFGDLLQKHKFGVIRSMVEASARLDTEQNTMVKWLLTAFEITEKADRKEFVNCLMRMITLKQWQELSDEEKKDNKNFHLQGSLIMQALAKMPTKHNETVVHSLLSQPIEIKLSWCYSPSGSRAFEAFLISDEISYKSKKKLFKSLSENYADLAKDKFGSHIVEKIWEHADIGVKELIAKELVKREYDLSEHYIGKCILWTCRIDQFKRRHDEWVEREKGQEKKKEIFKDIFEELDRTQSKKRKEAL